METRKKLIERVEPNKYGLQVFLEIKIIDCHQYHIEFSNVRKDPRRLRNAGIDTLTINPADKKRFKMDFYQTRTSLSRTIGGKLHYFDVEFSDIEFRNMEFDPNIKVTVRKSPWSNTKPQMTIKATIVDQNGKLITYYPFKGVIDQFDKEIDIVKH